MIRFAMAKKMLYGAFAVFFFGTLTAVSGQVRVSPTPNPNPKFKILMPTSKFDAKAAGETLKPGTSTIKGEVCSVTNGVFYQGADTKVSLYPLTPYLEEYIKLRDEKEDKNTAVHISDEAFAMRIDTTTNKKGEFQFTQMKPGKYYIITVNQYTAYSTGTVRTGTVTAGVYSGGIYENRTYASGKRKVIDKITEIKGENQTEKIILKSGFGGLINAGSCKRRSLGL